MSDLQTHIVPVLSDNYVYVLADEKGEAAIIDPGEAARVREFISKENLQPRQILLTHHHGDHVGGVEELKKLYPDIKVTGPRQDAARLPDLDQEVEDGQEIQVLGASARVISTPGHTSHHVCFYFPDQDILFAGDTLFSYGCGRVFEGTMEQMYESLQRLSDCPDSTDMYCGHEYTLSNLEFAIEYGAGDPEILEQRKKKIEEIRESGKPSLPSKMGEEKKHNPFMTASCVKDFARLRRAKDSA